MSMSNIAFELSNVSACLAPSSNVTVLFRLKIYTSLHQNPTLNIFGAHTIPYWSCSSLKAVFVVKGNVLKPSILS